MVTVKVHGAEGEEEQEEEGRERRGGREGGGEQEDREEKEGRGGGILKLRGQRSMGRKTHIHCCTKP